MYYHADNPVVKHIRTTTRKTFWQPKRDAAQHEPHARPGSGGAAPDDLAQFRGIDSLDGPTQQPADPDLPQQRMVLVSPSPAQVPIDSRDSRTSPGLVTQLC